MADVCFVSSVAKRTSWSRYLIIGSVIACSVAFLGCVTVEVYGPVWVTNSQTAVYTLDMEPYYPHVDATVYVIAEIPVDWTATEWSFSGAVDGSPVQGAGSWLPDDPGICPKSSPPAGYKRVHASSGVFADLEPNRDQVDAHLSFDTGEVLGTHDLSFWVEISDVDDVVCMEMNQPLTLEAHQWRGMEWEPIVGPGSPTSPGLGGVWGYFRERAEFEGALYTIFRPEDQDTEIWRTWDLVNWELARTVVASESPRELFVFDNRLMALAFHDPAGTPPQQWELWATENGTDWELQTVWLGYPSGLVESPGLLSAVLFEGDSDEYEYFLTTSEDGVNWSVVGGGPFAGTHEYVGDGVFFDGVFYFGGGWRAEPGTDFEFPRIWRFDGNSVSVVDCSPLEPGNRMVTSMAAHGDRIAVGTVSDSGGQVWLYDGIDDWNRIGSIGPGPSHETEIPDLVSHLGSVVALVDGDDYESQVWVADHNLIWSKSNLDDLTTGSRVYFMSVVGGELYAANGHRLWRRVLLFEDGFETSNVSRWSGSSDAPTLR